MEYLLYLLINLIFSDMPKDKDEKKLPKHGEVTPQSDGGDEPLPPKQPVTDPPPGKPDIKP